MVALGRGGAIVNLSSINAEVALFGQTSYATSKGGLAMLTRSLAVQLADRGIRVNAIGPGTIATEMSAGFVNDTVLSRIALRRPGRPEEIASIAVFLASDQASYVTGQTLYADGGRLAINLVMPPRTTTTTNG
jgi:NAD(P)-dependent dehydrogenase (short-subunit alcohol dehydrogenase family)